MNYVPIASEEGQVNGTGGQVTRPEGQVSDQVEGQVRPCEGQVSGSEGQVDERVLILLETATMPKTRAELLAAIGVGNKYERFARYVQPLIDVDWLEMTQPDSPRSPTQRYQITDAGRQVLDTSVH